MSRRTLVLLASLAALPAAAQDAGPDISLELPIDCTLGTDCYIQQYPDHDTTDAAEDYTCGTLSYDTHDGTDFALPSLAAQAEGVDVLASAGGTVGGVRDEMEDRLQVGPDAPDIAGRECGNGVVIRHAGGWETQYCHLALGSVVVAPGQTVEAGDVLGQVGLSGDTQFPHVHLSVRRDGTAVDPFAPGSETTCGADASDALWAEPLPYAPGGLITVGYATGVPDYDDVRAGTADVPVAADAPMVLWGYMYGGRAGDEVEIRIEGPEGEVVADTSVLDGSLAQFFRAAGRRAPPGGWPTGTYDGTVRLMRDGAEVDAAEATTRID